LYFWLSQNLQQIVIRRQKHKPVVAGGDNHCTQALAQEAVIVKIKNKMD